MRTKMVRRRLSGLFAGGNGYGDSFVMTVETTAPGETFTIPCANVGTFNATVNWGDGQAASEITAYNDADLTHTYASAGVHTIQIDGSFPNLYFNLSGDRLKVRTVEQLGDVGWASFNRAFYGCANMTKFHSGAVCDVSGVTSGFRMLRGNTSLEDVDLSTFTPATGFDMTEFMRDCSNSGLTSMDWSGLAGNRVGDMANALRNVGNGDGVTVTGLDLIDYEGLVSGEFVDFCRFGVLSTATYDALLIRLADQNVVDSQTVDFGASRASGGGAALAARKSLQTDDLWTINDGTAAPFSISSVDLMVVPGDFVVDGSNHLTAINPTYDNTLGTDGINIIGTPDVDVGGDGGIIMNEAMGANYVELDRVEHEASFPSGEHVAVLFKRNATADDRVVLFGTSNGSRYAYAAQNGSGSGTASGIGVTGYADSGGALTATRDGLWDATMADTTTRAIAAQDISTTLGLALRFGYYDTDTAFHLEGQILGFAMFTDWAQAGDVIAYLEANA